MADAEKALALLDEAEDKIEEAKQALALLDDGEPGGSKALALLDDEEAGAEEPGKATPAGNAVLEAFKE